ncbi:MAG: XRE family transcriptional regulator [Planctomycetota bacterium]|jgi:SOS-response transcriptional repressor LexA
MSLAAIIRKRREELNLTQDQVAEQAGISKPYLSNIETGKAKNPPTDRVLRSLERALQLSPGQLMKLAHMARTPVDVRQEHEFLEAEVSKLRSVLKGLLGGRAKKEMGGIDLDLLISSAKAKGNVHKISAGAVVPVINKVAAGYPQQFTDLDYPVSVADEYIRCPDLHDPEAFAARVVGDSMEPEYYEGDIVIFAPNTPAESGNDCFVRFESDRGTTFKRVYQDDAQTLRLQPLNSKYPAETYPRVAITGLWPAAFKIHRID